LLPSALKECKNMIVFSDNSVTAWVVTMDHTQAALLLENNKLSAATSKSSTKSQLPVNSASPMHNVRQNGKELTEIMTTLSGNGSVRNQMPQSVHLIRVITKLSQK